MSTTSNSVKCPKCGAMVPLDDETLAGPAIDRVRAEMADEITTAQQEAAAAKRHLQDVEQAVAAKERELSFREAAIETRVNQTLAAERVKIAREERENAQKESAPLLKAEKERADELAAKLSESQQAELALRKEKDALDQRERSLELEVARKVDAERKQIEETAVAGAEESVKLKLIEKDKTISDMQAKLEEAQRKANQGSQQLQGEALELDFECSLIQSFPQDTIETVRTGTRGGDLLQRVLGNLGRPVGTIFWETKRAQAWGADWAAKARQDAAEAKAEIAVIVSEVLPKEVRDLGPYDGVWVARPCFAVALGTALRQGLVSAADARQSAVGRESKMERLYAYMTGNEFRATLKGIALPFRELHEELNSEKRATLARWKRQERRIERVLASVAALQGDLQGIAGAELIAIAGFEDDDGEGRPAVEAVPEADAGEDEATTTLARSLGG